MTTAPAPRTQFDPEVERRRGWRGGPIRTHRAFAAIHLRWQDVAGNFLLSAAGVALWIKGVPALATLWARLFAFWSEALGWHAPVIRVAQHFSHVVQFAVPYVAVPAGPPDTTYWPSALITLVAFLASFFLPENALPWSYLLRALVILQATALVYFAVAAARFPHDLSGYTVSMLVFGALFIGLVPVILGFTFYLFDFSWGQKLALTAVTMGYLAVFIPFQYMLQVYVLHHSILLMPVLYFAFGPFLDVLVFVCFYSWGISWQSRRRISHSA